MREEGGHQTGRDQAPEIGNEDIIIVVAINGVWGIKEKRHCL